MFGSVVDMKSAVDTYLCEETIPFLAHAESFIYFFVSSLSLLYQAEERKGKKEERTARKIKLLDIMTGREAGEKEQMATHNMPVANAPKAGLTGRVSG